MSFGDCPQCGESFMTHGTGGCPRPRVDTRIPHPEDFCERCGRPNVTWFAPNKVWNRAVPEGGILCPVCFVQAAERAGIRPPSWEIRPEEMHSNLCLDRSEASREANPCVCDRDERKASGARTALAGRGPNLAQQWKTRALELMNNTNLPTVQTKENAGLVHAALSHGRAQGLFEAASELTAGASQEGQKP